MPIFCVCVIFFSFSIQKTHFNNFEDLCVYFHSTHIETVRYLNRKEKVFEASPYTYIGDLHTKQIPFSYNDGRQKNKTFMNARVWTMCERWTRVNKHLMQCNHLHWAPPPPVQFFLTQYRTEKTMHKNVHRLP